VQLGQSDWAAALLARHRAVLDPAARLELSARVAALREDWLVAAHAFTASALLGASAESGMRIARSADAFARAGRQDSAMTAYQRARSELPEVAGWLALREAALTEDTARAESLLAMAPPTAWRTVLAIRARQRLLLGDPGSAESLLEAAQLGGKAAELAIARGDTAAARRYAVTATQGSDTADVRRAVALLSDEIAPVHPQDALAAARAASSLRDPRLAAEFAALAVRLGDSSGVALLAWGAWLEQAGRRREALRVYGLAGDSGAFQQARARLRLGERDLAATALQQFATRHPADRFAPEALYLAADALASERLLRDVIARWPTDGAASRARLALAQTRLDARDTAAAIPYLEEEARQQRPTSPRARFLLGRAQLTVHDRVAGRETLTQLATTDSLGYYGAMARETLGAPAPTVVAPLGRVPSPAVGRWLRQLDILQALGFEDEADQLVSGLLERGWDDPQAMLDLADGLAARGRGGDAIRLGYAAVRRVGFNDPRVLRAVFPWPNRSLVEAEARQHGLDPYLVAALIRQESWFSPGARSRAGAVGYMQLMPATARELASRAHVDWEDAWLTVPDANMYLGCRHLAGLVARFNGDVPTALAAYNAGARPAERWRRRPGAKTPIGYVEQIAYPETQEYVRAVVRNRILYRLLYPPSDDP
jgi:peptidoglycan lytic transglycosylase